MPSGKVAGNLGRSCLRAGFCVAPVKRVGYNPAFLAEPGRELRKRRAWLRICAWKSKNKEIKVNVKMLFFKGAFTAASLWLGAAAWAQGGASASAVPQKVAVIDVRRAMQSTAEGKQVATELSAKYQPRQTELENLNRQLQDLQQRLSTGADKLSEEELNRLRREGQRINTQLDRKRNEYQEDLNNEQSDILDRLGHKLMDVVDRYARENGYSVVLDVSAQNTPVVYSSSQVDITQDIVRVYDQTYPLKAATAAPAQPRPAQPHQAPPQQKPQ